MQITKPASWQDMTKFHSDEYIAFLKNITPDIQDRYQPQMDRCIISLSNRKLSNAQIIVETIVLFGLVCTNFAQFQPGKQHHFRVKLRTYV
jgi:acetoin utilization deacetylase AcuC-like enzyme